MKNTKTLYAVDVVKYFCAIMVIFVHTSAFLPYSEDINWYTMTILSRFAVPFFFISTGYFCCKNSEKHREDYFKSYMKSLIKIYLIWSLIYLPLGINYIATEFDIPVYLYPLALLVALIYIGTYYHLWYMPALIFALYLVHWFMKHFRKRYILLLSLLCILLGAIETYYGFLHESFLLDIVDGYFAIFFTTRNGLFFGFFYVAWGYFIAQKNTWLEKTTHHGCWTILFFLLMIGEVVLIHNTNNLDSNILLMAAPFTICLFIYCLDVQLPWKLPYRKLREYSSLYYFSHAYYLVLIPLILSFFQLDSIYLEHGIVRFFSVLLCTHLTSLAMYSYMEHRKKRKNLQEG